MGDCFIERRAVHPALPARNDDQPRHPCVAAFEDTSRQFGTRIGTTGPQTRLLDQRLPRCVGRTRLREGWTMHISGESLLVILLVGLVAGWLAGRIVEGGGFGLIGDIAIGIVGAMIASRLRPRLGNQMALGILSLTRDRPMWVVVHASY